MRRIWLLLIGLAMTVPLTHATIIYSQDFEGSVGSEWSGTGSVQSTGGLSAFGFGSLHWRNDTTQATTLSLSGLAPHTTITLSFNLAVWDSVDLGDLFTIQADSTTLYQSDNSANLFGNYFPGDLLGQGPGTLITPAFTAFAVPDYGYNPGFRDSARFVQFTFAHSAPTLTITWQYSSSQGSTDESFGIDNVIIRSNAEDPGSPIPEPSTWALLGAGLVAVIARRNRTR